MLGLVLAVLLPSDVSLAVTVALPAVLSVTLNVFVPATSAAFEGNTPFVSEQVMPTASVTLVSAFQQASTALTVTLNDAPAVCADGVPVLPLALPGEAVSPGTSNCNFANAPTPTEIAGLVFAVFVPSVMSLAVKVRLPAVLSVTLKVFVPETSAAFAGSVALASDEVMPTVCVTLVTGFQFASTELIVTLKAAPAVWAFGVPVFPLAVPGTAVSPRSEEHTSEL